MNRLMILASVVALAAGAVGCGNSPGQANSLVDVGPSAVSDSSQGGGNLTTLAKGGGKPSGGGGTIGGGGGGTVSLVLLNSTDGLAHFTQTVTFNVSTSATAYPYVTLRCYQNNVVVGQQTDAMFPGSLSEKFTLGPTPLWTGGDADCRADLEDRSGRTPTVLASTSFHVYP